MPTPLKIMALCPSKNAGTCLLHIIASHLHTLNIIKRKTLPHQGNVYSEACKETVQAGVAYIREVLDPNLARDTVYTDSNSSSSFSLPGQYVPLLGQDHFPLKPICFIIHPNI
jgi:hypothetical protein